MRCAIESLERVATFPYSNILVFRCSLVRGVPNGN